MADINWIQVGAGFLSGGAFGALIKQYFDYRKSKTQTITFTKEIKPFFNHLTDNPLTSKIVIKDGEQDFKFQDLYIGSISIFNSSNQDFNEFTFGLTYNNENKFIQVQQEGIDRHHTSLFSNMPTLLNQTAQFDITIKPFNRKDRYKYDFIVDVNGQQATALEIGLGTSLPVNMKEVNAEAEFEKYLPNRVKITLPFIKIIYNR